MGNVATGMRQMWSAADALLGEKPAAIDRVDESAMIAALQAGDEAAFAQLITQMSAPLFSFLARSLADPTEAADVTQDVFLKVFRSVGGFHGESSLKTWIYRIAVHEASNRRRWWVRHRRAEVTIDDDTAFSGGDDGFSLAETLADGGRSPLQCAEQSEMRLLVEDCLRAVPECFRTVVILREIEGLQYEEIADILKLPLGTVRSRLLRGRAVLRTKLAERMPGHVPEAPRKTCEVSR